VPHPVTHTSSRLLEFETLRDLLAGYASSPLGQRRIAELLPSLDHAWIETQHQLTTEIREYRRVGGRFEFAGLPEVRKLIEKSRIAGAALETSEIRDVVLVADRACRVARNRASTSRRDALRVDRRGRAFRRHPGFHRLPAFVP
jgi:DNA mismatch repair protein MutS2